MTNNFTFKIGQHEFSLEDLDQSMKIESIALINPTIKQ
jgi:hypothetical protein